MRKPSSLDRIIGNLKRLIIGNEPDSP